MTEDTIAVSIGSYGDVSDRVVMCIFTQRPATNGIGTWQLVLDNNDSALNGAFNPDDPVAISINSAELFTGYIDKRPTKLRGVCENYMYLSGRDSGQDLQNKMLWSLYAKTDSFSGLADDIIQDMLTQTSSEITFTSPGTAPEIYYSSNWAPLSDQFKDILELINYAGFADKDKVWQMWPIATGRASGITLKSLKDDVTNNVVGDIDFEPGDTTDVRTYVIVQGPTKINDGFTEKNASGWTTCFSGDTISDYPLLIDYPAPLEPRSGVAAIKCTSYDEQHAGFKLTFPKYWLWWLDLHLIASDDLKFSLSANYTGAVFAADDLQIRLKDTAGNVIRWEESNVGKFNEWNELTVKVGFNETTNVKWIHEVGTTFNWYVTEIKITFALAISSYRHLVYLLLDGLKIPCAMVAANDQTSGSIVHTLRTYVANRSDITTQVELQQFADQLGPKLAVAIPSLNLTAVGNIGLISGVWKWLPGYYATVRIQDGNGNYVTPNNSKWRFMELTHTFDPSQRDSKGGHVYTVDLKMVPYDLIVDNQRWSYTNDPEQSPLRRLRDRLRYIENTQSGTTEPTA